MRRFVTILLYKIIKKLYLLEAGPFGTQGTSFEYPCPKNAPCEILGDFFQYLSIIFPF